MYNLYNYCKKSEPTYRNIMNHKCHYVMRIHWPPGRNRGLGGRVRKGYLYSSMVPTCAIWSKCQAWSQKPEAVTLTIPDRWMKKILHHLLTLDILASGNTCDALSHRMVWDTLRYSSQLVDFKVPPPVSDTSVRWYAAAVMAAFLKRFCTWCGRVGEPTFVFAKRFKSALVTPSHSFPAQLNPLQSRRNEKYWIVLISHDILVGGFDPFEKY